jgi:hypothetical protein
VDDELLRALARTQSRHAGSDAPMNTTADPVAHAGPLPSELVRPLDAAERAAILDAVFANVDGASSTPTDIASARASRPGRFVALVGAAIALAAAFVLWVAIPRRDDARLPSYELTELRGGASTVRSTTSDTDRRLELQRGDTIELTLTPATAIDVPLVVDVVAESTDGMARIARVPARVSPSGAVRLEGALDAWLPLELGEWRITVSVASAEDAPSTVDDALVGDARARVTFWVNLAERR